MAKVKNNNGFTTILIAIIIILLAIVLLFATGTISTKTGGVKISTQDNLSTKAESFLVGDYLVSKSNVVSSRVPGGYKFLENGNFAYSNPDFSINFTDSEENRLISYVGTWSIDGDTLTLSINKEQYAVGGTVKGVPTRLVDYQKDIKEVNKTIEYKINSTGTINENMQFITLISDYDVITWYGLYGVNLDSIKSLADNGYYVSDSNTIPD